MRITARAFGFLIALFFLLLSFNFSYAQTPTVSNPPNAQSYLNSSTNPDVPNNLHTLSQSLLIESVSAMTCQLVGYDIITRSNHCLGIDLKTGKIGYVKGASVIGGLGTMISALYSPPVHFSDYVNYLSSNFGIAKPSYAVANGIGFTSLSPLSSLWVTFRDIVYVLFVLVFVVIGVAIMLRIKIDPRTVMTIQNQIPKIIITIVLVTFSLAIAGLLIDFMWLVIYFIINLLASSDPGLFTPGVVSNNLMQSAPGFANSVVDPNGFLKGIGGIGLNASASVAGVFSNLFNLNPFNNGTSLVDLVTNPVGTLLGAVMGALITFVVGVIAFLVIMIALVWALFKLWFALIKAYVFIVIDIIFAPFWILGGLIPGASSVGFMAWIRDLLANLMAFPVVIAMLMLAAILAHQFQTATDSTKFIPPLIGNPGEQSLLGSLIALGIILATPSAIETVKKAFKTSGGGAGGAGKILASGASAGAAFGGAVAGRMYYRNREGILQGPIGSAVQGGTNRFLGNSLVRTVLRVQNTQSIPTTSGGTGGVKSSIAEPKKTEDKGGPLWGPNASKPEAKPMPKTAKEAGEYLDKVRAESENKSS